LEGEVTVTLQVICCKKCGTDTLVGIDGKDISGRGSGGETFIAFGNDEIEQAPKLKKLAVCPQCGTKCKIENIGTKKEGQE